MIIKLFFMILGVFLAAFGLEGFVIPNGFIDGGITGISLLLSQVLGWPLYVTLVGINLPFVGLAGLQFGWRFATRGAFGILGLACILWLVHFPVMTQDLILASIFGGLFIGGGIGLAVRGGGSLDGTEMIGIWLNKKIGITVGDFLLIFNVVLFMVAAYFFGVDMAMYSVLTYMAASKAVDFLLYGLEECLHVMIMSKQYEAIRASIMDEFGSGVTLLKGVGGFSKAESHVVVCVIARFDSSKLKRLVETIDPDAFITTHKLVDVTGGLIKKTFKV